MDRSPLRRLPPEIRNRIYQLVLVQPGGIFICATPTFEDAIWGGLEQTPPPMSAPPFMLSLLYTCKQVYQESIGMVYSMNTYTVAIWNWTKVSPITGFQDFIQRIGKQNSQALRHIKFETYLVACYHEDDLGEVRDAMKEVLGVWSQLDLHNCEPAACFWVGDYDVGHLEEVIVNLRDKESVLASSFACQQKLRQAIKDRDVREEELVDELGCSIVEGHVKAVQDMLIAVAKVLE